MRCFFSANAKCKLEALQLFNPVPNADQKPCGSSATIRISLEETDLRRDSGSCMLISQETNRPATGICTAFKSPEKRTTLCTCRQRATDCLNCPPGLILRPLDSALEHTNDFQTMDTTLCGPSPGRIAAASTSTFPTTCLLWTALVLCCQIWLFPLA